MALALAKLYHLTAKGEYRARAERTIAAFSGEIAANFASFPVLLNANDVLLNAVEVVIVGEREAADTKALTRAVYDLSLPNRVLQIVAPGTELAPLHPAHGRGQLSGKATAYVCRKGTCSLPVTEAAALAGLLAGS